ncbi:MAG: hypothetical protein U0559_01730 [Anaerolineae bacterium]
MPSTQAVCQPIQLRFEKSAAFTSAITVIVNQSVAELTLKLSQAIVTPPITITLTMTDSHPIGSPPLAYIIPITATGRTATHYTMVR